jgi:phenylpyruvate tautomerase PptA (4-oxalocrotonate tautomerase family)
VALHISEDLDPYPGNDAPTTSTPSTVKSLLCPRRLNYAEQKSYTAAGIARIHSQFTGAPVSFCQCIFRKIGSDAERTSAAKNDILIGIRDLLMRVLNVPESAVWVYLNDLAQTDMVEFAHVVPELLSEQAWVDELPAEVRDELAKRGDGCRD